MISRIKPKSDFARNVLTLMTGTTVAQAIPIAITPILTRIYTPEDFGVLALFAAITVILGSVANGRYELAIMQPEDDEDAINIAALGMSIAVAFSAILMVPAFLLNNQISDLLGNREIGPWLYFVPLVVLLIGLYNVLNYLNNRKKHYKDLALSNVLRTVSSSSIQLSVGYLKSGVTGLITGQIFAHFIASAVLIKKTTERFSLARVERKRMWELARKYVRFPKYTMWAGLANSLSQNLTSILISGVYSISTLGFYSLTQKVLMMPASLISGVIGQVFYQEASEEKAKTGSTKVTYRKTLIKLVTISTVIYFVLYWVVVDLFVFAFGPDWAIAGEYARILIPLFCIQFFVSPLTLMNIIHEKNAIGMWWQFIMLFLQFVLISCASIYNLKFENYLYLVVVVIGTHYLVMLYLVSTYDKKLTRKDFQ